MDNPWWYLLWTLQWSLNVEGIYHLKSMQEFVPPTTTSKDSLFGYSIAYQPTTKRMIISAPNNDVIGKIYDCNIQNKQCVEIGNNIRGYKFEKMWLGATVATSQNFTMACAPRYIEARTKTGTFGKCFASSPSSHNMTDLKSISEKDQVKSRIYEYDMDSLGWSIDVTKHGTVLVGGPAMYKGRVIVYYTLHETPTLLNFTKGSTWNIQYNYGYSVVSGHFTSKNSDKVIFAISSPYGALGLGLVILFNGKQPSVLVNPRPFSPQVGAMFGAAMAAANLLVGQPQALLVGAPAYSVKQQDQVDIGAVYIYQYDEKLQVMTHQKTILGQANKGRFGSAIISLGDLNNDGKHEIAISAPYEGSGVVYIYSGAHILSKVDSNELRWLQRIQPSTYKAFGLSLTALQDYDGNGYNEIAIGAPDSNRVVVLSCMSKITVKVNNLKPYPRSFRNDTHFLFQSCVDIKYPAKPDHITAEIQVIVGNVTHATAKLVNARADGSIQYTINIKSKKETHVCHDVGITVPMEVGYHPMIQYQIKASQLNSPEAQDSFNATRALLSDLSELEVSHTVWVADCSGKDECKPELSFHVNTTIPNDYVIGSSVKETVSVVAVNRGDVAYSPCMYVYMMGVQVLQPPPTCQLQLDREGEVLYCQPSTPVKNNTAWESGDIELDIKKLNSDSREITFRVDLFPLCGSNRSSSQTLTRQLRADSSMIVRGATNIGDTVKVTEEELEKTGKRLTHDYSIYNNGTTDWVNIKCELTLLDKKPFFEDYNANIEASSLSSCTMETEGDKIVCIVEELKVNHKFVLMLPLYVLPGKLHEDNVNGENIAISSHLKLIYGDYRQEKRVTSKIKMRYGVVPLWIIIIAALVGLLIICIIVFALYECGFLRRKNKDKLQRLRRSVYRQSVRRSQIRESMRSGQRQSAERQKLLEQRTANERDDILDEKSPTDENVKRDDDSAKNIGPKADDENPSRTLPEEGEECKIRKKEQIIKGLQKNLDLHRSNQFLAPRLKEHKKDE